MFCGFSGDSRWRASRGCLLRFVRFRRASRAWSQCLYPVCVLVRASLQGCILDLGQDFIGSQVVEPHQHERPLASAAADRSIRSSGAERGEKHCLTSTCRLVRMKLRDQSTKNVQRMQASSGPCMEPSRRACHAEPPLQVSDKDCRMVDQHGADRGRGEGR